MENTVNQSVVFDIGKDRFLVNVEPLKRLIEKDPNSSPIEICDSIQSAKDAMIQCLDENSLPGSMFRVKNAHATLTDLAELFRQMTWTRIHS